jgi:uncharacterized membrane protein required for colicin V production
VRVTEGDNLTTSLSTIIMVDLGLHLLIALSVVACFVIVKTNLTHLREQTLFVYSKFRPTGLNSTPSLKEEYKNSLEKNFASRKIKGNSIMDKEESNSEVERPEKKTNTKSQVFIYKRKNNNHLSTILSGIFLFVILSLVKINQITGSASSERWSNTKALFDLGIKVHSKLFDSLGMLSLKYAKERYSNNGISLSLEDVDQDLLQKWPFIVEMHSKLGLLDRIKNLTEISICNHLKAVPAAILAKCRTTIADPSINLINGLSFVHSSMHTSKARPTLNTKSIEDFEELKRERQVENYIFFIDLYLGQVIDEIWISLEEDKQSQLSEYILYEWVGTIIPCFIIFCLITWYFFREKKQILNLRLGFLLFPDELLDSNPYIQGIFIRTA